MSAVASHRCRSHTTYTGTCMPCRVAAGVSHLPMPTRRDLYLNACPECGDPAKTVCIDTHVPGANEVVVLICPCA